MFRVAVVRFPGSNCDFDSLSSARRAGTEAYFVWHRDTSLEQADAVLLPGGFSYGDYLRPGAIARFRPIMPPGPRFAGAGGPVRAVLECAGIHDVLSKSLGSDNAINVVHATVAALKGLMRPEEVAARRGLPLEDVAPAALLRARAAGMGA